MGFETYCFNVMHDYSKSCVGIEVRVCALLKNRIYCLAHVS